MKVTNDKILKDLLRLKEDYTLNLEKSKDKDNLILEAGNEDDDKETPSLEDDDKDSSKNSVEDDDEAVPEKENPSNKNTSDNKTDKDGTEETSSSNNSESKDSKKILNFETPEVADLYSKMKKAKTPSDVALATKSFLDYIAEAATNALNS